MGAALVGLAIALPWLVWLPFVTQSAALVLLGAIAIIGALHGWGRLVARLANRAEADAALAMQWGLAAVIAVGGIMLALRIYDAHLLLVAGIVMHSVDLALRVATVRVAVAPIWRHARYWVVPIALVIVVAVIHVLAAAGQVTARPFDDEGHVFGQIQRLIVTGGLEDPIGYPRNAQLGGHVSLSALAAVFGDARLGRIFDRGIGLTLFLLLVAMRARPRDAASAIWTTLLVVLAASFTLTSTDVLPLWIPAGLILALHATVSTAATSARAMLPIGLIAGSLWALRCELAPLGLAMVAATWWTGRTAWARDWRRVAMLVGSVVVAVGGYVIARHLAWSTVADGAGVLLSGRKWPVLLRLALAIAVSCALAPLFALATRELQDRSIRWLGIASGVAVAAIATRLVGTPPTAMQLLWPIAIAGFTVLALAVAQEPNVRRTAMIVGTFACVLVFEAQMTPGRHGWAWRTYDLMFDVQYARNLTTDRSPYAELLARVPAGERVVVWLARPDLLDYTRHEIIDLRTPRVAKVAKLDKLVHMTKARWLLVETLDDAPFATVLEKAHTVVNTGAVRLVELR